MQLSRTRCLHEQHSRAAAPGELIRGGRKAFFSSLVSTALLVLPALAGALLAAPATARADALSDKADAFLVRATAAAVATKPAKGWSQLIVRTDKGGLTEGRKAQIAALGGDVYRHLPLIDAVAVRVPTRNVPKLAALSFVQRLSADVTVRKNDEFTVPSSRADVAYSQYGLTGSGVAVAVVDSGIRPHYDLTKPGLLGTTLLSSNRIVKSVNFVAGTTSTNDACGHGTHIAGIIAGNGTSSHGLTDFRTFYGIARSANLVNVRVLDGIGQGTVSSVVAGIQWVIANKGTYKIRVMNLSLGHPVGESYTTDPLCLAVEQAWKAGIVVVCAAGNQGRLQDTVDPSLDNEGYGAAYGSIQSPGNSPYAITVGATKQTEGMGRAYDRIATYSSRGPTRLDLILKPDIVAPGNRIISVQADQSYLDDEHSDTNQVPWGYYRLSLLGGDSNKYYRLSGTSMAAPVVAGAAALMLQKDPTLSPDTVKARLMASADKWTYPDGQADPCTFGAGYINIPAALSSTLVATQYALSPRMYQDPFGYIYIDGLSIWGTKAIWGTGVTDLKAIWGTKAIWGVNTVASSKAIWGTSIWFDKAIWGVNTGAVDLSCTALNGEN